eukprot:CAMPEP_0195283626 /NCGR_PEP_ID=MMETSP0707-20130614/2104_1 /TAXON_ID=33640 /ORGANISM="Asterionellopsis glacialis, Strain CCMP134" /LENGTH=94 /DNA_ID=CAMNT_0040342817 /DNA_START=115 /DNA_END=395 /DNA_ORIENTATION=-
MPGDGDKAAKAAAQAQADTEAKNRARKPALAPATSLKKPDTGVNQPPMPRSQKGPRGAPASAPGVVHLSSEGAKTTAATSTLDQDIMAKNRGRR